MRRRGALVLAIGAALLLAGCSLLGIAPPPPLSAGPPPLPPFPRPPGEPSTELTTPGQVRGEIARWFAASGYRDFQVAALIAHARIESNFQPCVAGAADLRYLYQWGGTRLQRLHKFARAPGCPPLDTQLAFANDELRKEPRFACFWDATTASGALAALRRGFGRGSC
ncbi:MAG TPA: phage tail tip lysozyme [Stellaceae bacterium]|nr:phage tail tip lysozyme [Stellaceae bacterium]